MTEAEWLACTNPQQMLTVLRGKVTDRKWGLFGCACSIGSEMAEDTNDLDKLRLSAFLETQDWVDASHRPLPEFWRDMTWWPHMPFDWAKACCRNDDPDDLPLHAKADFLRCIFGPLLFRPITIDPKWLTWNDGTVPNLAQAIYDERRFEDTPILADALMDAGCHDEEILAHCRGPGPHVRGCWVVDLLLAKE
jgi:hypothetical protein